MSVILDTIVLPDLVIANEVGWTGVYCETERALDGSLLIWENTVSGEPIDLIGGSDIAWIDRDVLMNVKELAEVSNAVYTLEYEGDIKQVRFRHEDGNVISATPLVGRPNREDSDRYANVIIKLMEV